MASIYQRKDGRWVVAWKLGQKRVVRYAKTREEAESYLAQPSPSLSVRSLWQRYCETRTLKPTTLAAYNYALTPFFRYFAASKLTSITAEHLRIFFQQLPFKRQSLYTYQLVNRLFRFAVEQRYLGQNPMQTISFTAPKARPPRCWTKEQAERFINYVKSTPHYNAPFFLFLLFTGLRVGEALGLTWEDVRGNTITINKQVTFVGNRMLVTTPKTASSYRQVSFPSFLRQYLPEPRYERVWTTESGAPLNRANLNRNLKRLCQRAGVPPLNVHALRHVHASLLLSHHVDLLTVSHRLGHSKLHTTLLYLHRTMNDPSATVLTTLFQNGNTTAS